MPVQSQVSVLERGRHSNRSTKGQCIPSHAISAWLQDMHFLYVLAAANLYARMHGLPGSQSQPALRELLERESDCMPQNLFSAELGEASVLCSCSCPSPPQVFSSYLEEARA